MSATDYAVRPTRFTREGEAVGVGVSGAAQAAPLSLFYTVN